MKTTGGTAEVTTDAALPRREEDPAVAANARMLTAMELAAARLLRPWLAPGQGSVGLEMSVTHLAPVACGAILRCVATHERTSGRQHQFTLQVFEGDCVVARAVHIRAIVVPGRLLAGARRRAGLPAMLLAI
jgi:fluoroacetyl-CoA thioesterase